MRCLVFDRDLRVVGSSVCEWSYLAEKDASTLARAFDAEAVWRSVCRLVQEALGDARSPARDVAAVSVTSQRQSVVFLDEAGEVIYAGPNQDLRAFFEGAAIDDGMRDAVHETTGHLPSFLFAAAKLRWFQGQRPEAYARIAAVLTLADWLAWQLTGVQASETSLAGDAGLLDISQRRWCSDLLASLDLFSAPTPLVEAGTPLGEIRSEVASATGLRPGTTVVVAGADTQCGLLGLGLRQEHDVGVVAGWSAPLQMISRSPVFAPNGRTWTGCSLEADRWVAESTAGDIGNSYRWLARTLSGDQRDGFAEMDALASAVPVGSEGTVALLGHTRMDMSTTGMRPGGILFPVPVTHSETGREHLIRASLEGFAYSIKGNLEQLEELAGCRAERVGVGGGMTRTGTFTGVLADVLGREISVSQSPDVTAVGACLCALAGLGEVGSFEDAASLAEGGLVAVEPDLTNCAEYEDHYGEWARVSEKLQEIGLS